MGGIKNWGWSRDMRIFIAIELDNNTKSHLCGMAKKLMPYFTKARHTRLENHHITLKFIGEAGRTEFEKVISAVKKTVLRIDDFTIRTSGAGNFKKRNRHIFYCSVEPSLKLQGLYSILCRELNNTGIETEDGKYTPHITLAREVVLDDEYPDIKFESKVIKADSISVMESTIINGKLTYIQRFRANLRRQSKC